MELKVKGNTSSPIRFFPRQDISQTSYIISKDLSTEYSLTKKLIATNIKSTYEKALGKSYQDKLKSLEEKLKELGVKGYSYEDLRRIFTGKEKAFKEFEELVNLLQEKELPNSIKSYIKANKREASRVSPEIAERIWPKNETEYKRELLRGVLKVLQRPELIKQGENECVTASLERALIEKKPEEYIRIVKELGLFGKTKLSNGEEVELDPWAIRRSSYSISIGEKDYRFLNSKIFQNSLHTHFAGSLSEPISEDRVAELFSGVLGKEYVALSFKQYSSNGDYKSLLKLLMKKNDPIFIAINLPNSSEKHMLRLRGIKGQKVILDNPWRDKQFRENTKIEDLLHLLKIKRNSNNDNPSRDGIEVHTIPWLQKRTYLLVIPRDIFQEQR